MSVISGSDLNLLGVKITPHEKKIRGNGVISYGESYAGYDLRLGPKLLVLNFDGRVIDPKVGFKNDDYKTHVIDGTDRTFIMDPYSTALGSSVEHVDVPDNVVGICLGKSTYARCNIIINATPIEPGWHGHVTLEIINASPRQVAIHVGEGIAQVIFISTTRASRYDGAYQGQRAEPVGPIVAK